MVAFYLSLNLERIFVVRSFNYIFDQLNEVGYLLDEMLPYFDPITVQQLRNCTKAVHEKKEKFCLSEMFSCELKFVTDLLKKRLAEKYFDRYKESNFFSQQKFKKENRIDWNETKYVICNFCLPTAASNFPTKKNTTYLDFITATEHVFIRKIFDMNDLKLSKLIHTQKKYHEVFRRMLQIVVLVNTNYSSESDIGNISDDCMVQFVNEMNFDNFINLYLKIENTQLKNIKWEDRRETKLYKPITFVYSSLIDLTHNKF